MSVAREIRRYAAYFKGWCQAFGEHEAESLGEASINWLYAENKVGLILPQTLSKQLHRKVLGKSNKTPLLTLGRDCIEIEDFNRTFTDSLDLDGLVKLKQILEHNANLHLYLTYHFVYPKGTRIITFSTEQPLSLIYKEIEPLQIQLVN